MMENPSSIPPSISPPSNPVLNTGSTSIESAQTQQAGSLTDYFSKIEDVKRRLKTVRGFKVAAEEFIEMFPKYCNDITKRDFYGALTMINTRAGGNGFDPAVCKRVFDVALIHLPHFTAGFQKNIREWAERINDMVAKGTFVPQRRRARSNNGLLDEYRRSMFADMLLRSLLSDRFGGGWASSDSSDYSEDSDDSDGEDAPRVQHVEYPYAKFTDDPPILNGQKLGHSDFSFTRPLNFHISESLFKKVKENDSMRISLCCYTHNDESRCVESPEGISYSVNGIAVSLEDQYEIVNGLNITSLCKAGINVLVVTVDIMLLWILFRSQNINCDTI
eukprot:TRINITY_DN5984_c0_g1_i3.p1 TRINITY_DN5984_c0_g1~~TRINITY_DN5984_c0_g1_i3.p1  ORF type:complete len:333 (+),score=73.60 TRINITY_DN5984_c0_g1_i3:112-1110(+)